MPKIFVDGREIEADRNQSVLDAALAAGVEIPYFCWHPKLSVSGSCRVCAVQVEGRSWVEIACNMPVTDGLKVLTDTELVRDYRKSILQLTTLNHPVDCGICDKAGECTLQDYHYKYNGEPSISRDPKVRTRTTSSTSARSARCFRVRSSISRAFGISSRRRRCVRAARAAARSTCGIARPSGSSTHSTRPRTCASNA
jgi:NADH dehydrogenase/NADH:ubiquinone oxidoreductase subunit G